MTFSQFDHRPFTVLPPTSPFDLLLVTPTSTIETLYTPSHQVDSSNTSLDLFKKRPGTDSRVNSVPARDVARFALGLDPDHASRDSVIEAILFRSEYRRLYLELVDALRRSSAELEVGHVDLLNKLNRAERMRVCFTPAYLADSSRQFRVDLNIPNSDATCSISAEEITCTVPKGFTACSAVVLQKTWAAGRWTDDLTRRRVHSDWSISSWGAPKMAVTKWNRSELSGKNPSSFLEHRGETLNVVVAGNLPGSARVVLARKGDRELVSPSTPLPLLFTGYYDDGRVAHESRLLTEGAQTFDRLFANKPGNISWLDCSILPPQCTSLLNLSDAANILALQNPLVVPLELVSRGTNGNTFQAKLEPEGWQDIIRGPFSGIFLLIEADS
jgi:hypothetical protein